MALIVGGWHGDSEDSTLGREVRSQVQVDMATQLQLRPLEAKLDMLNEKMPALEGMVAQMMGIVDGLRQAFETEVRRGDDRLEWWKRTLDEELELKHQDLRFSIVQEVQDNVKEVMMEDVMATARIQCQQALNKDSPRLLRVEAQVETLNAALEELKQTCSVAVTTAEAAIAEALTRPLATKDFSDEAMRGMVNVQAEKAAHAVASEVCDDLLRQWQRTWRVEEERAFNMEEGLCRRLEALEEQQRGGARPLPEIAEASEPTEANSAPVRNASPTRRLAAPAGNGFETILRGELKALLRRLSDQEAKMQEFIESCRRSEAVHMEWERAVREEVVRATAAEQEIKTKLEALVLHAVSGGEPNKHVEDQLRKTLHDMQELRGQMNALVRGQDRKR